MNRYRNCLVALITSVITLGANLAIAQQHSEAVPDSAAPSEPVPRSTMSMDKIKEIIAKIDEAVEEENGNLTFHYDGAPLMLISDETVDRMRIVSPVIEASQMTQEQIVASLISNYHLALDARYAIGGGILYSAYIHPLADLTEKQLVSAVRQVASLRNTFGQGYSSGELSFGAQSGNKERVDI